MSEVDTRADDQTEDRASPPTDGPPPTDVPAEDQGGVDRVKADLERQVAELTDAWQRSAAELDNYRKRTTRESASARAQERATVAARWLAVVDDLERALHHAETDPGSIVEGVRAVHQQAMDVLSALGYPRRDDVGKGFDPTYHEAVSTVADGELPPGTVAQVLRPGYGSDDQVLRPAAVVVATGT